MPRHPSPQPTSSGSAGDASNGASTDRLLAVYLRDHFAAAAGGLALAERCRRANVDEPLGAVLAEVATEIAADRASLRDMMTALDVSEDRVKAVLARAGELVARVKSNGMLTRYSPSSRVVELEALLAGIDAKRNLWRALRVAAPGRPALDVAVLDELIARATAQRARLRAEHERAAAAAFSP
jgi:hypothetical protein